MVEGNGAAVLFIPTTHILSMTSTFVAVLVLLLVPLVLLWRLTETRPQTMARLRRQGLTWQQIGARYGVHRTTAYRWSLA